MSTYSDPALILPNAVGTNELQDNAVTSAKLSLSFIEANLSVDTQVGAAAPYSVLRTANTTQIPNTAVITYVVPAGVTELSVNGTISHNYANDGTMGFRYSINGGAAQTLLSVTGSSTVATLNKTALAAIAEGDVVVIYVFDSPTENIGKGVSGNCYLTMTKARFYAITEL